MTSSNDMVLYPRTLRLKEQDVLESVLPIDSYGYAEYRSLIAKMLVLGEGRRGAGNIVLGYEGDTPDNVSPLAPVIAYGVLETTKESFYITVREYVGNQIDVEIVSSHGNDIPDNYEEKRRWTYSTWKPGQPSPSTGEKLREVQISSGLTLGILPGEKRLLLHEHISGMNHLIPITNFYNELMLYKGIRDPKVALQSTLFFQNSSSYTDDDLRTSFVAYNKLKRRVSVAESKPAEKETGVGILIKRLFGK